MSDIEQRDTYEEYCIEKYELEKKLDDIYTQKMQMKKALEEDVETQTSLVSLFKQIYENDTSLERDAEFMEAFNIIEKKASEIIGFRQQNYEKICKEIESTENRLFELRKASECDAGNGDCSI